MDRRAFLIGTSSLALAQLASGCSNQAALKIRLLKNSIPAQLVGEFKQQLSSPVELKFEPETQIKAVFKNLQAWKKQAQKTESERFSLPFSVPFVAEKPPGIADLVTLGDAWLELAITQQLIQPLDLSQLQGWKQLPPRWSELVKRDNKGQLSPSGLVWGAPYRWGTTVIAYNKDLFKTKGWAPPKDWADLWRPELRGRISLLDQPREVIGLTLKKLGESYNTTDLSQVSDLKKALLALHQQAKLYSSNRYLEPLLLGDTDVAVGWSTDVLPLRTSYSQIKVIVPPSGTALWVDLWVQPAAGTGTNFGEMGERQALMKQWINFCWQAKQAHEISLFSNATSPIITGVNRAELPEDLRNNRLLLPEESILEQSEFLKPLPQSVLAEYLALWKEMRLSKVELG
jgi:putative spermidine/putrescine transport system substrate-binding protein